MIDPANHCLFARGELAERFSHWEDVSVQLSDFDAPGGQVKSFATVIARKPRPARG